MQLQNKTSFYLLNTAKLFFSLFNLLLLYQCSGSNTEQYFYVILACSILLQ